MKRMPTEQQLDDLMNKNWEKMHQILEQELPQKKKKKRMLIWWFSAACIIFASLFGIKEWLTQPKPEFTDGVIQKQITIQTPEETTHTVTPSGEKRESNLFSSQKKSLKNKKTTMKYIDNKELNFKVEFAQNQILVEETRVKDYANKEVETSQKDLENSLQNTKLNHIEITEILPLENLKPLDGIEKTLHPTFISKSKRPASSFEIETGVTHSILSNTVGYQVGIERQIPLSSKIGISTGLKFAQLKDYNDDILTKSFYEDSFNGQSPIGAELSPPPTNSSYLRLQIPVNFYWKPYKGMRVSVGFSGVYNRVDLTYANSLNPLNSKISESRQFSQSYYTMACQWNLQYYFDRHWSMKLGTFHQLLPLSNKYFFDLSKERLHEANIGFSYRF